MKRYTPLRHALHTAIFVGSLLFISPLTTEAKVDHHCKVGARRCQSSTPQICKPTPAGHRWFNDARCLFGCKNGHCNRCRPDSARCVNSAIQRCIPSQSYGYLWSAPRPCPFGCSGKGYCNLCRPGSPARCNGTALQQCKPTLLGQRWIKVGECNNKCTAYSRRCLGDKAQFCKRDTFGYRWHTSSVCQHGCSSTGFCNECRNPNLNRCDGFYLEQCQSNGSYLAIKRTFCPNGCHLNRCR